jgi:hypothetical protein
MQITVFTLIAVMVLLVSIGNRLPDHWRSRCLLCGGHEHTPDCPWNEKEN